MTNRLFLIVFVILVLTLFLPEINVEQVLGLDSGDKTSLVRNQTIPTRTPTPGSPASTPTSKPKDGGGNSATAVPTSTSQSLPTATATQPIIYANTPEGGFVPTAESCSSPPTIQAKNPTNVRRGPGTNYSVVGRLVYLEVRFILGRAADAEWWLIQLDDGDTGWVANDVVTVQGYIGGVPIVPAPEINGDTPTPGIPWNPTPLPFCTVTPTATAEPSATPEPTTAAPEATPTAVEVEATAESSTALAPTETPLPPPTQTAVSPPTLPPTAAATEQPDAITAETTDQPVTASVETADSGSTIDWLLPVAGLLLVAGGVVAFYTRRQK